MMCATGASLCRKMSEAERPQVADMQQRREVHAEAFRAYMRHIQTCAVCGGGRSADIALLSASVADLREAA